MQLELTFSNELRHVACVDALITSALGQLPLDDPVRANLLNGLIAVTEDTIQHAYPDGESGLITLSFREKGGRLEITVRDYGIPRDVDAMELQLHGMAPGHQHLPVLLDSGSFDEIHWLNFGPQGKALQILKWLESDHVANATAAETLRQVDHSVVLAPEQSYDVRRMRTEEAEQVSQLMYRVYGNTYFNEDIYYPDRIAAQHQHGVTVSYVAVDEAGEVVGHYALERIPDSPVAEVGQAVVDPYHRRRGLLDRMKQCALQDAAHSDLVGWYADAVTVHTFTQQSNVTTHGCVTAANLGIAPGKEHFDTGEEQPQRVTCLLYFHWLQERQHREVYVPVRHRTLVGEIYEGLGCKVEFREGSEPADFGGMLSVSINAIAGRANLTVTTIGKDTVHRIRHARRNLVEQSHLEVLFLDLPIADPGCAFVAEAIEHEGFGFLGIGPQFSASGDVLRFAYLVEPLCREPIKTLDEAASRLVDYALNEQARLRELLS